MAAASGLDGPDPVVPISRYLTDDGALHVEPGRQVALDPSGYRMVLGANGEPRFVKAAAATAEPGDDPWSAQFSLPGAELSQSIVETVIVDGSDVFVGGRFDQFERLIAASIVRWNGSSWSTLGGPGNVFNDNGVSKGTAEKGTVHAITVTANYVYVGGNFTQVNSGAMEQEAPGLARWDRSANTWEPLDDLCNVSTYFGADSCFNNDVGPVIRALTTDGTDLFVGGSFDAADNDGTRIRVSNLAKWSFGSETWSPLLGSGPPDQNADNGTDQPVYALLLDGTNLFVGGEFFEVYEPGSTGRVTTFACSVVRFDLSALSWTPLGGPGANDPSSAECDNGTDGLQGDVYALAGTADQLYIGGRFAEVHEGGTTLAAENVARWDGSAWQVLGTASSNGVDASVDALLLDGTDLYLSGNFDRAFDGGTTVRPQYVARWDGSTWQTLGGTSSLDNGLSSRIRDLAKDGAGRIWAVGAREACDTQRCRLVFGVARWTGSGWLGPPTGTTHAGFGNLGNSRVNAIVVDGADVYVGGQLSRLLDPTGTTLYVGNVARWTGSSWELFGGPGESEGLRDNGVNGVVHALLVQSGDLYVGGDFDEAIANGTGIEANNVVRWDGAQWVSLGGQGTNARNNGVNGSVFALEVYDGAVHVGGAFRRAYTTSSEVRANRVVRWDGSSWIPLGGPGNQVTDNGVGRDFSGPRVYTLEAVGSALYVGGDFERAYSGTTTLETRNITRWDGSAWNGLGGPAATLSDNGLDKRVRALAYEGGDLFAGGIFEEAANSDGSTVITRQIARWDGSTWSPLAGPGNTFTDNGINGEVHALSVNGGFVFAGGRFLETFGAGGGAHRHITAYNRSTNAWEAVGSGTTYGNVLTTNDGAVYGLALGHSVLQVGGNFTRAGGKPSYGFGQYDVADGGLPVELAGFSARRDGERVHLTWRTASETKNAGFHVDRLERNGWQALGFVEGRGTTESAQSYRFTDRDLPFGAGTVSYRLRQVDFDGTATLSEVATVRRAAVRGLRLMATYPNPVRSQAAVRLTVPARAAEGSVQLALYDLLGRRVRTVQTAIGAGRHEITLDTSGLASGVYFLRLTASGAARTQRLTVVR